MLTKVFVPLGHEVENGELSGEAKARCRTALYAAWEAKRSKKVQPVLGLGAGAIPGHDMETMAAYAQHYCERVHADLPMLVNRDDTEVMSTITELQWVAEAMRQHYGEEAVMVVVSQPRHLRRVRLIHHWFLSEVPMEFAVSEEVEHISLLHEFLGYSKLVAMKLGLGGVAERFRLFTIWLWHRKRTVK